MENARTCVQVVVLVWRGICAGEDKSNHMTFLQSVPTQTSQSADCHPARSSEGSGEVSHCGSVVVSSGGLLAVLQSLQSPQGFTHSPCDPSCALHAFLRSCSFQQPGVSSLLSVLILHVWQSLSAQES